MSKAPTRRRLLNIARRMADGETFYFSDGAPRITRREVIALGDLGLWVQEENGIHESHMAYMMTGPGNGVVHEDQFRRRLSQLELAE